MELQQGLYPYLEKTYNVPAIGLRRENFRLDAALKQEKLIGPNSGKSRKTTPLPNMRSIKYDSGRIIDIDVADFKGHPLWNILIETARNNPLFLNNAAYAHNFIIPDNPTITPKELASRLSITVGEALAILEGYEKVPK